MVGRGYSIALLCVSGVQIVTWVESVLLFLLLLWFALVALLKFATCCARMGSGKPKPTKLENDTKANANADAN